MFSDKKVMDRKNSNMNLDIFNISPNIEKIRNRRLSFQQERKLDNHNIREDRCYSLESNIKKKSEPNINDKIFSFQMMGRDNNTKVKDLLPNINKKPSAPPLYPIIN